MTKIFCDYCSKEIESMADKFWFKLEPVDSDEGELWFSKEVCRDCAKKLKEKS